MQACPLCLTRKTGRRARPRDDKVTDAEMISWTRSFRLQANLTRTALAADEAAKAAETRSAGPAESPVRKNPARGLDGRRCRAVRRNIGGKSA